MARIRGIPRHAMGPFLPPSPVLASLISMLMSMLSVLGTR